MSQQITPEVQQLLSQLINSGVWLAVVYWLIRPAIAFGVEYARHRFIGAKPPLIGAKPPPCNE